jgi:hypothetical protein
MQSAHEAKEANNFDQTLSDFQTSALSETFQINKSTGVFDKDGDETIVARSTNWEATSKINRPSSPNGLTSTQRTVVRLNWSLRFAVTLASVTAADELCDVRMHAGPIVTM